MAISWVTALKVIPWGDVIEAAPGIVKGARKFFAGTQVPEAEVTTPVSSVDADTPEALRARVSGLERHVAELSRQQQESAALIASLAQQNEKVVQAIELLRVRTRVLLIGTAILALGWGLLAWRVWG